MCNRRPAVQPKQKKEKGEKKKTTFWQHYWLKALYMNVHWPKNKQSKINTKGNDGNITVNGWDVILWFLGNCMQQIPWRARLHQRFCPLLVCQLKAYWMSTQHKCTQITFSICSIIPKLCLCSKLSTTLFDIFTLYWACKISQYYLSWSLNTILLWEKKPHLDSGL